MAKEDFCFTYYDGDAARDKSHLDRLQRGAYDDIISAQRKFGHLTIEIIKRVLGSDFDHCWPPIEWILKKDGAGKFFIEWLENSIAKSRAHAKKQKERIDDYWAKKRKKTNHGNSTEQPPNNHGISMDIPLEDGDENGNEDGSVKGDEKFLVPQMCLRWYNIFPLYTKDKENDYRAMYAILQFMMRQANLKDFQGIDVQEKVLATLTQIGEIIIGDPFWSNKPIKSIANNIQEFYNKIKNPSNGKQREQQGSIRDEVNAVRIQRRQNRQQAGNESGVT